jgi:alkylhydroperoxidase/carboxymuconolactone decarboxylase family protein YurZ
VTAQARNWSEADREALKAEVMEARGRFRPWHQALLEARPSTLKRMSDFVVASEQGPIGPGLRHLIWTAVDAVVTHLYPAGIAIHARVATQHGVSAEQVFEALELACMCVTRTFEIGLPIVQSLTWDAPGATVKLSPSDEALLERCASAMGEIPSWVESGLRLDPAYTRTLIDMVFAPEDSTLPHKWRMLICLAIASCPAIADRTWIERYAAGSLRAGASTDELVACLKLASGIGIHALAVGAPAILEGLAPVT